MTPFLSHKNVFLTNTTFGDDNGESMYNFSSIIHAYNGHNFDTTKIYDHIVKLQHMMNKGDISKQYEKAKDISYLYDDNITLGLDELVKYESMLGDDFGDKKR